MKKLHLFVLHIFICTTISAQKASLNEKIIKKFKKTKNDSVFISKHSDQIYKIDTANFYLFPDTASYGIFHKELLKGEIGEVLGPYENGDYISYYKIISVDSSFMARVGNIFIDINKGRDGAMAKANYILTEIQKGKDFDVYCKLYSDDKNNKKDCDLGWFNNTIMVSRFAKEIIKHKKNEVFIVETEFGFHVVKALENPYKIRRIVCYTSLSFKK